MLLYLGEFLQTVEAKGQWGDPGPRSKNHLPVLKPAGMTVLSWRPVIHCWIALVSLGHQFSKSLQTYQWITGLHENQLKLAVQGPGLEIDEVTSCGWGERSQASLTSRKHGTVYTNSQGYSLWPKVLQSIIPT